MNKSKNPIDNVYFKIVSEQNAISLILKVTQKYAKIVHGIKLIAKIIQEHFKN